MTALNEHRTLVDPDLTRLVSPRSIALIGATDNPNSMGYQTFRNIAVESDFRGTFYPISARLESLEGHTCYPSISAVPETPDVAVIAIPARFVLDAVRECAESGVSFGIIFSSGFGELGEEGIAAQRELREIAERTGMRLYGPNCPGLTNIGERVGMSFSPAFAADLRRGPLALVTQGGGLGRTLLQAGERGIGASVWASVGNAADLDVADFVSHFATDDSVSVICALMEGINDGDRFVRAARKAALNGKPLVALKAGRSELGRRASRSHTATLAGSAEVNSAVFAELGIVEVDDTDELMDIAWMLSRARPKPRTRFAVFGSSGGAVTFATDFMAAAGLELAELSEKTLARVRAVLPGFVNVGNPVDVTAAVLHDRSLLVSSLRAVMEDPGVDAIVLPIPITYGARKAFQSEVFADLQASFATPLIPIWMSDKRGVEWDRLTEAGLASARGLTKSIAMLKRWVAFGQKRAAVLERIRATEGETTPEASPIAPPPTEHVAERDVKEWLREQGIRIPQGTLVRTREAAALAVRTGCRYVAKVSSPDIAHKSDVGGVVLDLESPQAAAEAYDAICANVAVEAAGSRIEGVLIEEQVPAEGMDLVIGVHRDEIFGRILTVGAGGVYVEILNDVQRSMLPVDRGRAKQLLTELKSWPLLVGTRGQGALDISSLVELIERVSMIAMAHEGIEEIELNPVRVSRDGAVVLDALLTTPEHARTTDYE